MRIQPAPQFGKMGIARNVQGYVRLGEYGSRTQTFVLLACHHVVPADEGNARGRRRRAEGLPPLKRRCWACLEIREGR